MSKEGDDLKKFLKAEGVTVPGAGDGGEQFKQTAKLVGLQLYEGDAALVVPIKKDLNVTARQLGHVVSRLDMFRHNGELVFFDHEGKRARMTAMNFCTWINNHVIIANKWDDATGRAIPDMLSLVQASVVLACIDFQRGVRPLESINSVRLPVVRADGKLELLPWGYDEPTAVYTVPGGIDYAKDMEIDVAKNWLLRMFGSFPFSDDRSMAVQVAAMLSLYVRHLPGGGGVRPGFLWLGNKPGCGKSALARAAQFPVLGRAPAAKLKKDDALDKEIEGFLRAGVSAIFIDNVYGGIESPTIDQMLTGEESTGRALGSHDIFTVKNSAQLFVTGNGLELNDDAVRRFLVVDIFEKGKYDDRGIPDEDLLQEKIMKTPEWRSRMLSILWALVKNWSDKGMPRGSLRLASFEGFSIMMGGIVEAAGYAAPFQRAEIPDAINAGDEELVTLLDHIIREMEEGELEKDLTLQDLVRQARAAGVFVKEVGTQAEGRKLTIKEDRLSGTDQAWAVDNGYLTPSHRSSFGKRLKKFPVGTEYKVGGLVVKFGNRDQAGKSAYKVQVIG